MHEIIRSSQAKWDGFYNLVDRFISQGYNKTDEEEDEETGLNHELISKTITVELKPPNIDLPQIKLEAFEQYGIYNYDKETFEPWDGSKFEMKARKKGSRSENFNDRWDLFDLS